jgi:3'-phosphoadenosine 5'-phosphosulfate sulfotransferase (PAPS reductase)/FAD synthetase
MTVEETAMNALLTASLNRARRTATAKGEPVVSLSGEIIGTKVVDVYDIPTDYSPLYTRLVKDTGVTYGGYETELPAGRSLDWYDIIGLNTSAGKDSVATAIRMVGWANELGIADRMVFIHADLGDRIEWPDTAAYAAAEAEHLLPGARFEIVTRVGTISDGASRANKTYGIKNPPLYAAGEARGDIVDGVIARWNQVTALADALDARGEPEAAAKARKIPVWPSRAARSCTKDFKTGPVYALYTKLANEWRERTGETRECRILNCLGIRGQEGDERCKKPSFKHEDKASSAKRHIDTFYPIHWWTKDRVWDEIRKSGAPHHWAYDLGMPRLSCPFCVLAGKSALMTAAKALPERFERYLGAEKTTGSRFAMGGKGDWDGSLAGIKLALEAGEAVSKIEAWEG